MRFRLLGILGWIIVLLLIGVVWLFAKQLNQRLAIESTLRADVGGLSIHRGLEPASSPNLVILGDSRAASLGKPEYPGCSVLNLGVPGQATSEILARAGRDLVLLQPDAVVLIAGVNDLKSGDRDAAVSRSVAATNDIMQIASKLDVPILVIDTWPHAGVDLRSLMLPSDLSGRCLELSNTLRNLPADPNVRFADVRGLLGDDGLVRSELAKDALHLNEDGNRIMIETILNFLETDVKASS